MKNIVVVGSLNMDLIVEVDRVPKIGETIKGENMNYLIGGKGCNQAVAASRLGNKVKMIGCVGDDSFGNEILNHLKKDGVNVESIKKVDNISTGIATIFKMKYDNSIIVIPAANNYCSKELIDENIDVIKNADILITQLEIPIETVEYVLKIAKENGVKTILNPAPAREISNDILKNVDFITPNETEFEIILKKELKDTNELEEAMIYWQNENKCTKLIVTRGKDGSSYVEDNKVKTITTIKVDVIDTTGAGDTFNGALAHGISNELLINDAITFAGIAASLSVTKFGAQTGMPEIEEVKSILNNLNLFQNSKYYDKL